MRYIRTIDGKQEFSNCRTIKTKEGLWISNPTEEQIKAEGWEEYVSEPHEPTQEELKERRKEEILAELRSMDYLTSKYIDGEDMTQYGDWQGKRKALRAEYNSLQINE